MRQWKKIPRWPVWTALVLAGLILGLILFLALFDFNALRGPLARFVSERIHRDVRIERIDAHLLSFTPHVEVGGLAIGNPRWAGGGEMANVGRIAVDFKLMPLFIGNLIILRADIENPVLNFIRKPSGEANWQFEPQRKKQPAGAPADLPVVRNFKLSGGRIEVSDGIRKLRFNGTVSAGESLDSGTANIFVLKGTGELNRQPFELSLNGGALINVERDKPYPYDADIRAGNTRVSVQGTVARPFDLAHIEAAVAASGDDLADLYYFTGLALPNTPPYKVSGRVQRDGTEIRVADLKGTIGDSDIQGDMSVDTSGERPALRAEIVSRSLDLDDLAASLGAAPQSAGNETISPKQRQLGAQMAQQQRLFPDARLQVERVRGMDADFTFHAQSVKARKIPMRQVAFHLKLNNGVLNLDPVSFVLPQGKFAGNVRLDARSDIPRSHVDFSVSGVQLGQFKPKDGVAPLEGTLLGRVQLDGEGDSILKVVSSANGSLTTIVPRGEIREAFAELTGINLARGLGLLLTKDQKQVNVRCGVADFQLHEGRLDARTLVFDTENVLITGGGNIQLDKEALDLTIEGKPKKLRLLRLRAPITVKGPLRKPDIGIKAEKTAGQTGAAAVLAAIAAPIAAVIAFVDPGLAKDADCSALLAQAEQNEKTPLPPAETAGGGKSGN